MTTTPTVTIPDIPIRAMCCGICCVPATAKVTTRHGVIGACIAHVRTVTRIGR